MTILEKEKMKKEEKRKKIQAMMDLLENEYECSFSEGYINRLDIVTTYTLQDYRVLGRVINKALITWKKYIRNQDCFWEECIYKLLRDGEVIITSNSTSSNYIGKMVEVTGELPPDMETKFSSKGAFISKI